MMPFISKFKLKIEVSDKQFRKIKIILDQLFFFSRRRLKFKSTCL